VRKLFRLIKI